MASLYFLSGRHGAGPGFRFRVGKADANREGKSKNYSREKSKGSEAGMLHPVPEPF